MDSLGEYTRDPDPPRNKYILYCKDFFVAARYAAAKDWWLHSWKWHTDDYAPDEVVEYTKTEAQK